MGSKPLQPYGLVYQRGFLAPKERVALLDWLGTLHPIWEERYSKNHPPPPGEPQRKLLRPVYWLGNWQFACLNYFHPPKNVHDCCVRAESFPPVMQKLVDRIHEITRRRFREGDIPKKWHLNTCLVNYYGSHVGEGGKENDVARVGEHRDFEPGPVASLSLGERALFQFVASSGRGTRIGVELQQWLEDSALQVFGGKRFKNDLFHRVQRVEEKRGDVFPLNGIENFRTRRINFTFRYVPDEYICDFSKLPSHSAEDVEPYVLELAKHSKFWQEAAKLKS